MKTIPEDRSKNREAKYSKNEIVEELSDKGRDIAAGNEGQFTIRILHEHLTNGIVHEIIDDGGTKEGDGRTQQYEPCPANDRIEC